MKKWFILLPLFFLTILGYTGCTDSINSQVVLDNKAAAPVFVNFRADEYAVPSGQTLVIKDVPKGAFDYSTTYQLPAGITQASADGAMAGTVTISESGARVLIIYASIVDSTTYKISATYTTNQDNNTLTGPTGP